MTYPMKLSIAAWMQRRGFSLFLRRRKCRSVPKYTHLFRFWSNGSALLAQIGGMNCWRLLVALSRWWLILLFWQLDIHKTPNFKGYTALLGENTDVNGLGDLHEGFDMGWEPKPGDTNGAVKREDGVMTGENVWPENLPGFRETALDY